MNESEPIVPSLKEVLTARRKFPPRAPLTAQLEVAWLDGDDAAAAEIYESMNIILSSTKR